LADFLTIVQHSHYDIWNSKFVRMMTPDFINIGAGFNGIFGLGAGQSMEANFVMHGPEASFKPVFTATSSVGIGFSVDATFNVGVQHYTGDVDDINADMLETNTSARHDDPTAWGSGGFSFLGKVGFTGSYTHLNDGFNLVGAQVNVGLGLPVGELPINAAGGVSNSFILPFFRKK